MFEIKELLLLLLLLLTIVQLVRPLVYVSCELTSMKSGYEKCVLSSLTWRGLSESGVVSQKFEMRDGGAYIPDILYESLFVND